jgi:ubiquinone/menaquinone biosynthesis C-methylase UbiE
MVDLDLDWARVASLRNPNVEIIRGDATKLPIRDDMFDVVISQAMLEHIPDHTAALHEMCRTTRAVLFVAWGPNKNSLYDFGHLDAPVTLFSRKNAKKVAILWHKMLKTDRTHEWISSELDGTFYISTGFVKRLLKTYGTVFNVFTEFCMNSLRSEYSYRGGRIKNLLAKMPMLSKGIFKLLEFLMIEPQCYYILIKLNEHNEPRS